MIINLTPHPIHLYRPDAPDCVDPAEWAPTLTIPVGDLPPARLGVIDLGTNSVSGGDGIPVEYVEYGRLINALPAKEPEASRTTWYVVSLAVALLLTYGPENRDDLLVPYREVRNLDGTVVGCRLLARPV